MCATNLDIYKKKQHMKEEAYLFKFYVNVGMGDNKTSKLNH
jgi:hypothetical protein